MNCTVPFYMYSSDIHIVDIVLRFSNHVYYVVKTVFIGIHTELWIDISSEDISLINILDRQYHLRTTENFEH